jgi:hypothetical protein
LSNVSRDDEQQQSDAEDGLCPLAMFGGEAEG